MQVLPTLHPCVGIYMQHDSRNFIVLGNLIKKQSPLCQHVLWFPITLWMLGLLCYISEYNCVFIENVL